MGAPGMVSVFGSGRSAAEWAAWAANCGLEVLWGVPHPGDPAEAEQHLRNRRHPLLYAPSLASKVRCVPWPEFLERVAGAQWVLGCHDGSPETLAVQFLAAQTRLTPRQTVFLSLPAAKLESVVRLGGAEALARRTFGLRLYPDARRTRLVGLVAPEGALAEERRPVADFWDRTLGKRVAWYPDAVGSGGWALWVASALQAVAIAERLQLPVGTADRLTQRLGLARDGLFTDMDRLGLDRILQLASLLADGIADWDLAVPRPLAVLVDRGWTGAAVGRGFYRTEAPRETMPLDLATCAYREPSEEPASPDPHPPSLDRIRALATERSPEGEFAKLWVTAVARFAVRWRPEAARTAWELDAALEDGFGWRIGPLKLAQAFLPSQEAAETPYYGPGKTRVFGGAWAAVVRPEGCEPLRELAVIEELPALTVRQGSSAIVLCLKPLPLGRMDTETVHRLTESLENLPDRSALLAAPEGWPTHLDVGRLLKLRLAGDTAALTAELEAFDRLCQLVRRKVRASLIAEQCLGAGLSLALSAPLAVAARSASVGFPDVRLGLPPVGLGPLLLAQHALQRGAAKLVRLCRTVFAGDACWNAVLAAELGLLRDTDLLAVNPDRLIEAVRNAGDPEEPAGPPLCDGERFYAQALFEQRSSPGATAHDGRVAQLIKAAWSQSTMIEDGLARQRAAFVEAIGLALTQARIRGFLATGRPLRN